MASVRLKPYQKKAVDNLTSGSLLCGKVGSGKTLTALSFCKKKYKNYDIIVITTAKKRDSKDWEHEADRIGVKLHAVDSWNNILKYVNVRKSFFIFDEQNVTGYGVWTRAFIHIAKANYWVLLSGTPGDEWIKLMPVFVANGYYRNKTDFINQHVVYNNFAKFPMIDKYINLSKLEYIKSKVVKPMNYSNSNTRHIIEVKCKYDKERYLRLKSSRQDEDGIPIDTPSRLAFLLRQITSQSEGKLEEASKIIRLTNRLIVVYNYTYEFRDIVSICKKEHKKYYVWNGKRHDPIPDDGDWIYIVQSSAAIGWNCISTNSMMFYSLPYTYSSYEQACGRIDRMNNVYKELYYYILVPKSPVDKRVWKSIRNGKNFNANYWED